MAADAHPEILHPDAVERVETVGARMLVLVRCVLAYSALVIIWIDPSEPTRLVEITYASLAAYCLYATLLALVSWRQDWAPPDRAFHWADIAFYAYLVALTEGTSSIFFYFFFFPILVASFAWGFREGLAATLTSYALFMAGIGFAPSGEEFELNRTLIRSVYLFVFGYLFAYWGGYERLLKRRLRLLQDINNLWNPRFGVDHAIGSNLDRLIAFYGANSAVLVLRRPAMPASFLMYTASREKPGASATPREITQSTAGTLANLPENIGAYYHDPQHSWRHRYHGVHAHEIDTRARSKAHHDACAALANLLDAQAYITVPYAQSDGTTGRLYLVSARGGFIPSDIDFLAQVADATATVVENMFLMEELISRAAEHERLAVSRDLHDTTIQPYIGLKLALDALQREAGADGPMAKRIAELVDMTTVTIRDLRHYAETLKEKAAMPGEFLVAAVKRQSERLGRFYGLHVEVTSDISSQLKGRIAAEAFQIISEGLSNVLRHGAAKKAFVSILCENANLLLKIGNEERDGTADASAFTPRSIHERSQALGGSTFVERRLDGYTVVHVTIPM
ncbi:MAG: sensor histidine kinase [Betaproteobacteria bacterium]